MYFEIGNPNYLLVILACLNETFTLAGNRINREGFRADSSLHIFSASDAIANGFLSRPGQ